MNGGEAKGVSRAEVEYVKKREGQARRKEAKDKLAEAGTGTRAPVRKTLRHALRP